MVPVLGNLLPEKISFLPSMRYYAGNWATSHWLFRIDSGAEAEARPRASTRPRAITIEQLTKLYGREIGRAS